MRTVIVRLAEPEQAGGSLHGLVEVIGAPPVPFSGDAALLALLADAASRPQDWPLAGPGYDDAADHSP